MKKSLETLIISALLETEKYEFDVTTFSFEAAISLLLKGKKIFEKVPKRVIISSDEFKKSDSGPATTGLVKDLLTDFGKTNNHELQYFEDKGILLHDGLHASAFGKMSYIYRTKGIRLYLLQNQDLIVVTPYCYIDHRGFEFVQEEVYREGMKDLKSVEAIRDLMVHTRRNMQDDWHVNKQLLQSMISIKKVFKKHFYLEYLLTPPDVDELSEFSIKVRRKLWDICLSESFSKKWGAELQENAINYLSHLGIAPSSGQIFKYLKELSGSNDLQVILDRMDVLEKNLSNQKADIFEFKPNISGIGINGNEIYQRLKQLVYKLNL